jgi:hypothetical protein
MNDPITNIARFKDALKTIPANEVPIIIPVFNLCSYADNMVQQLLSRGITSFIVCDNASTYPPMVEYLDKLSTTQRVVRFSENLGPRCFAELPQMLAILPEYFIISDPDLVLNPNLPPDFIDKMKDVINAHNVSKAGFALDIYDTCHKFFNTAQVHKWEGKNWEIKVPQLSNCVLDDIYRAPLDTTFCLFKKSIYFREFFSIGFGITATSSLRIAGRFTCEHMGWWENQPVPKDEMDHYKNTQRWSSTCDEKTKLGYN